MWKWILRRGIRHIKFALSKVPDEKLKQLAESINKKLDIPRLNEEQEMKVIYRTLVSCIELIEELLDLIKL